MAVLGNIVGMIDTGGAVAAGYTYDPYGTLLTSTGTAYNPWLYKTGYRDAATNLTKFGNRYYDPTTGRWTQQDSLTLLNDPTQGNRYAFAGCDAVNNSDLSGRFSFGCAVGAVANAFNPVNNYLLNPWNVGDPNGIAIQGGFDVVASGLAIAGLAGIAGFGSLASIGIGLPFIAIGFTAVGIGVSNEC